MSDDSKFNPPPAASGADRTIIIPTPGARTSKPAPAAPIQTKIAAPAELALRRGLNPLVNSATTLLTVAIKLRTTMSHADVPDLHRRLTEELKAFESKARNAGASQETLVSARYLLCTIVDEIVLNTPWGANSGWSQHSLLSLFHHETFGGEKCFVMLQQMLQAPSAHLQVLELFYLCLSLGFEGKYRLAPRGHEQLEQVRDNLFHTIENFRGQADPDLSPHWESRAYRKKSRMDYIPLWVVASCVLAIGLVSYSGFRWWLDANTSPVEAQIIMLLEQVESKNKKIDS